MKFRLPCFLAVLLLALAGCNYDSPLTATPTQKVDERLLGEWVQAQPEEPDWMVVRRLDASTYIVAYGKDKPQDRPDVYRAFHSDFAGKAFLSVQNLQPGSDDRKYTYLSWSLSVDGTKLTLRSINTKVIPGQSIDTAGMQKLVEKNLQNPELLNDETLFVRPAPAEH
jgi:hypothetical protein